MNTKFLVAGAMALIVPSTLCLTGCSFGLINTVSYQYENADKYTAGDREIDDTITKLYREEKPTNGSIVLGGIKVEKLRNRNVFRLHRSERFHHRESVFICFIRQHGY